MSDGGRERASLGVEVWKSSQKWSVQRSAVRSIAWLDASCLECAPNVRVMEHDQNESGWSENGDKRAQTDQQAESWM